MRDAWVADDAPTYRRRVTGDEAPAAATRRRPTMRAIIVSRGFFPRMHQHAKLPTSIPRARARPKACARPASFSGSLMSNQRGGVLQPSWSDIVALAALVYLFYYILALALKRARANTPSGTSAGRRTQATPRRSPRLKKAE